MRQLLERARKKSVSWGLKRIWVGSECQKWWAGKARILSVLEISA